MVLNFAIIEMKMAQAKLSMEPINGGVKDGPQSLRIDRYNHKVKAIIIGFTYIDKDTNQYVVFMPSLELSGYGRTKAKAMEMLESSLEHLLNDLLIMSEDLMTHELRKLGWSKSKFFHKEFLQPQIDEIGFLRDINAEGEIERFSLAAA